MPFAPARLCTRCRQVHVGRGCPASDAAYEQARGTAQARGYDSVWARYSKAWRKRYPLCGMRLDGVMSPDHSACVREGRVTEGTVVDHIIPFRGRPELKYDAKNHQTLCKADHDAKTATEDRRWGDRGSNV